MNNKIPRRFRNKLIRALRSGRYKQTFGEMKSMGKDEYDVFGVAYRLAGVNKGTITKMKHVPMEGKQINFLPKVFCSADSPVAEKLLYLNDVQKMPFKWLASYIETHM